MINKDEKPKKTRAKAATTKNQTEIKKAEAKTSAKTAVAKDDSQNSHLVTVETGSKMISNLREMISEKELPFVLNHCYDFDRSIFDLILNNNVCTGIRIYFGLNDDNALCLVFTGLNGKNDIYIPLNNNQFAVADMGEVCVPTTYGKSIMLP